MSRESFKDRLQKIKSDPGLKENLAQVMILKVLAYMEKKPKDINYSKLNYRLNKSEEQVAILHVLMSAQLDSNITFNKAFKKFTSGK